jgi:adenylate cyclase
MKKRIFQFRVLYGIILINAVFVIISGTTIILSMWVNSENNARELSGSLINEIENSVINQTVSYFATAKAANQNISFLLYRYFGDPVNNLSDRNILFGYYEEIMKANSQFKMIYYADTTGDLVMLFAMNDGTFSRRVVHNTGTEIQINWDHPNPANFGAYPNTVDSADTGYDPRKRFWYQSALAERSTIWTPVYLFATDNLPGFTCATPIFDLAGNVSGVSSIDIAVDELSRFLGTMHPTPHTRIFVLDKQYNLVALQADTEKDLENLFVTSLDAQGNTVYNVTSVQALQDTEMRTLLQRILDGGNESALIEYRNGKYISTLIPVTIDGGLDLFISIIIPENDIVGNVRKNLRSVTVFSVGILIFVLLASAFFSQAIAKPMRILSEEMSKIKTFQLDSHVPIKSSFTEIAKISDSFENMKSGLKNFKRYVPAELVAQLINESITADLGGDQQELTMFFSDIAKFTSIAEKMPAEKLVEDLCVYFEIISKTIIENSGTIDKYIGDSVMAFWGAPVKIENHAEKACESAILVRNNLHSLFRQWENKGKHPFLTRIGIHTGSVIVGNMGYKDRLNYTVIGDAVNISSRLEGINKIYGTDIVVSQYTQMQSKNSFEFRHLDRISVLGGVQALDIFELITFIDDIDKTLKKVYRFYEHGLQYYFDQNWGEALKCFATVLKYRPNDIPSRLMQKRCLAYQNNPPPKEWNGVFAQPFK